MLEKMKDALSALSVIAATYTPKLLKEALLCLAKRTDENTSDINDLSLKVEAIQRENARAKLATSIATDAMLGNPDCPDELKAIVKKMMAVSEGRNHG